MHRLCVWRPNSREGEGQEMTEARENGYTAVGEPEEVSSCRRRLMASGALLRFLGASLAILVVIISWVITAEKLQKANKVYRKPFFITYWVHGFGYSLLYIVWQFWLLLPRSMPCTRAGEGVWLGRSRQLIILSGVMAVVAFSSEYTWYYSLTRTNIPANIAIYQSACVWVFLLSIFLLRERITVLKILAVAVSVTGVVIVAVFSNSCSTDQSTDHNSTTNASSPSPPSWGPQPLLGHIHRGSSCTEKSTFPGYLALFYSVISYAVFEVGYKKWGSEETDPASVANSLRYLGYLGLQTLVWLWPGFLILHYSGVEPFEWPPYDIFILLVWNALLNSILNAGMFISIALTSVLFASVGTVLVIPAAVLVDWLLQGFLLQFAAAVGVVFIIMGFIGFVTAEMIALKLKEKESEGKRDHQLLVSCCCSTESGLREEGEEGEDEEEPGLRRKRTRAVILRYLL